MVSFKFYVMNFVDFVVDFYSHIILHVSQAFTSCTHNTSYSLLNIAHISVCVFMVWPTKFEKCFEFYTKLICCLKKYIYFTLLFTFLAFFFYSPHGKRHPLSLSLSLSQHVLPQHLNLIPIKGWNHRFLLISLSFYFYQ